MVLGIPPGGRMAPDLGVLDCGDELLCGENVDDCVWPGDYMSIGDDHPSPNAPGGDHWDGIRLLEFPVEDDTAISALLAKEERHIPRKDYLQRHLSDPLYTRARQSAVSWIIKFTDGNGYSPLTAFLAVNYLDRFLSCLPMLTESEFWKVELAGVTCLGLAAKMEEIHVPTLFLFQESPVTYIFDAVVLRDMELVVLRTLDWRMSAVTPFSYIDYYLHKLGIDNTMLRSLLRRVMALITGTVENIKFVEFPPSSVAAAAVLLALLEIGYVQTPPCKAVLCEIPGMSEKDVDRCLYLLTDVPSQFAPSSSSPLSPPHSPCKRKGLSLPQSPVAVLDAAAALTSRSLISCGSDSIHEESSPDGSPTAAGSVTGTSYKKRRLLESCDSFEEPPYMDDNWKIGSAV